VTNNVLFAFVPLIRSTRKPLTYFGVKPALLKASAQADRGASGPGIRPAGSGSVASLRPSFLSKKPHCPAEPNAVASCAPFCSLPPAVWMALNRNWVWKAASPADRRNSILIYEFLKGSTHCPIEPNAWDIAVCCLKGNWVWRAASLAGSKGLVLDCARTKA
jgi:hypothetical protein